ncbi:MAG: ATP-binding protein [Planctomycetota bacterium]|jgi:PAS domain S-box-containing protein
MEAIDPISKPLESSACKSSDSHHKHSNIIRLLKKSRREFLMVFDSVPAMIWYRDRNGKILRVNQCAADSVNRSIRELVGKNYYELFPDGAERSRRQDLQVIQSGQPLRKQIRRFKGFDGKTHWAMVDRIPLRDKKEGKIVGVMVFAEDITEQKIAEEKLVRAKKEIEIRNEQLRTAAEKARELAAKANRSNQAKSEVLASSTHDLRTPMNAIIGFSDLLQDTELDEEQAEYATTIHKSATGLLALINDILDYTKLEAGKLNIQIVPCNLAEFLKEIESMMAPGARQKGLTFNIHIDPVLSETFFTDPVRLKQCLINVIGNAVKFTPEGRIDIHVRPEQKGLQSCLCFEIEDTGIGIPNEKQAKIFRAFSQADKNTDRTYGGTGLGLSITRKLTDLLGGHISVASEEQKGSTFSIILPLFTEAHCSSTQLKQTLLPQRQPEVRKSPNRHVLVAESNVPSQLMMNLLLRRASLEVESVCNREHLLKMTEAFDFDMILLDLSFEKGHSLDIIRRLRKDGNRIPIIAIADCDMDLMEEAMAAGCNHYVSKPMSRRSLYEAIDQVHAEAKLEQEFRKHPPAVHAAQNDVFDHEIVSEKFSTIVEGTFQPGELTDILGELFEHLRDALDTAADEQAYEVIEILRHFSRIHENSQLCDHVNELKNTYSSAPDQTEQITQMIVQLQQLCDDVLLGRNSRSL